MKDLPFVICALKAVLYREDATPTSVSFPLFSEHLGAVLSFPSVQEKEPINRKKCTISSKLPNFSKTYCFSLLEKVW